jgi:hypothetical protein
VIVFDSSASPRIARSPRKFATPVGTDGQDTERDLHLMLCTPGGDGETALRLARIAQAASHRFVLLVPHAAKSAVTVLARSPYSSGGYTIRNKMILRWSRTAA